MEFERGSTRSNTVENLLWKRLWTCRKTDYVVNELQPKSLTQNKITLLLIMITTRKITAFCN